jgi:hypothetical protein
MSNKVTLGSAPRTFKPITVTFMMPDGTEGKFTVVYKYRSRKQFGAWLDELLTAGKAKAEAAAEEANTPTPVYMEDEAPEPKPEFRNELFFAEMGESAADYLTGTVDDTGKVTTPGCVESWDLEFKPTRENVLQMADELPAAISALMESYRSACRDGRLGN